MKIQELVDLLTSYGYTVKEDTLANIGWAVEQSFSKVENPTTKYDRTFKFTWGKKQGPFSENEASFNLFETDSVNSDGIKYDEPGRKYYFYSFDYSKPSKIYKDDEIENLTMDIHTDFCSKMSIDEVRHIKLISILNRNKNENIHA